MKRPFALLVVCVLLLPLAVRAQSEEGYDSRSYARLSYISGEVKVQRAGDMGYEAGTINLALIEGDKLAIQEGRAEVSLGRQNFIRLDRVSQLEFVNLPRDGYESYKIHLLSGRLYLRVSRLDQEKEFEVHTPDASFYILETGLYRLDVADKGETRLAVVEGRLEAAGETGSLEVGSGQSLVAKSGNLMSRPDNLYAEVDDFSRWNQSRDSLLASRSSSSYLPQELNEYGSELDEYGDWHYEADYGYVWVPQVDSYNDWHPYFYGRWVWYPVIGWTWVPDEPWGWCVYHYGRWHWSLNLGWYWMPTRYWGPAWVHWYRDNDYLGWCPLNRWNRPVVVINNIFYPHYGNATHSVHNRALTVISRNQLQARRVSDVALRGGALERIGRLSLSGRQPSLSPTVLRSGRLYDQARRTFEQSAGRLSRSIQERSTLRSPSSERSFSGGEGSISRRLSSLDRGGSSGNRTGISSRRIQEFSPGRSPSIPSQNRLSSTDRGRSLRSSSDSSLREFNSRPASRRSVSSEFSSRGLTSTRSSSRSGSPVSTRRSVLNRESSSRLSSADRSGTLSSQRNQFSSSRSSSWSSRLPSRSSVSPSYSNSSSSSRSESGTSRSSSWRSSSPSARGSYFSNRGSSSSSSSSSSRSFSIPSRSYSAPSRSSSSPSRSFSSPSRSYSAPSHSVSPSHRSSSSSSRSGSSHSSSSRSSSSGSRIRNRDR